MEVFREIELRNLSKGISALIPKNRTDLGEVALNELELLLGKLLLTAEEPRLSATHRAASCNALCGFLEQGATSQDSKLRASCFNPEVWDRMLSVYLERIGDAKAKPMRRILLTLVKLLYYISDNAVIKKNAVHKCLALIYLSAESPSVKAAMHVLEIFLSKKVITFSSLLDLAPQCDGLVDAGPYLPRPTGLKSYDISSSPKTLPRKAVEGFVYKILQWIHHADAASAAGRLLFCSFESLKDMDNQDQSGNRVEAGLPLWAAPIQQVLKDHPNLMEAIQHHVLPDLLRLDHSDTGKLIRNLPLKALQSGKFGHLEEESILLCLVVIRLIQSSDFLKHPAEFDSHGHQTFFQYDYQNVCSSLLVHASPNIRIAALSILIYSSSLTSPFAAKLLLSLRQNLPNFHAESDPKTRGEFLSIVKTLIARLQAAIFCMRKVFEPQTRLPHGEYEPGVSNGSGDPSNVQNCDTLSQHTSFLGWYLEFLYGELQPTASYQRHITALKVLQNMRRSIGSKHTQTRILLELVMDPFDDVRGMAAGILKGSPSFGPSNASNPNDVMTEGLEMISDKKDESFHTCVNQQDLLLTLTRAEYLMYHSGRADYADGVGRLYSLKYKCCSLDNEDPKVGSSKRSEVIEALVLQLEEDIMIAQKNMRMAVSAAPLHGRLIALRYIVSRPDFAVSLARHSGTDQTKWKILNDKLLEDCEKVWRIVKDVLCFDSPEGHALDDPKDGLNVDVKNTLSFSWRALKEASSLMHAILTNPGYSPETPGCGLLYDDLQRLGGLAFTQLAELRHRGAFSTVSQTFSACCVYCAKSNDPRIANLPKYWYHESLLCIQEKASALTRRSAGLPAMITSILAAYPGGTFFDDVILDLQAIADAPVYRISDAEEVRLPQVHALNCMKDVFTSTRLGPATEPHLATTLEIAVECLENDIWAIRNCGLMLLRALLIRLSGGNGAGPSQNKGGSRHFSPSIHDKYPSLSNLVVHLLKSGDVPEPGVYKSKPLPALSVDTSQRFQVVFAAMEIIDRFGLAADHQAFAASLLMKQLDSPLWAVRKKAAATLSLLVDEQTIMREIQILSESHWPSQNALHGRLLCLKHIIVRKDRQDIGYSEFILYLLVPYFDYSVMINPCPFTAATYLDILTFVLTALVDQRSPTMSQYTELLRGKLMHKWQQTLRSFRAFRRSAALDLLIGALAVILPLLKHESDLIWCAKGGTSQVVSDLVDCGDPVLAMILANPLARLSMDDLVIVASRSSDHCIKALAMDRIVNSQNFALLSEQHIPQSQFENGSPICTRINSLLTDIQEGCTESIPSSAVMDSTLQLGGITLAEEYRSGQAYSVGTRFKVERWTRMLRLAVDEGSILSTRLAAVSSLTSFQVALRQGSSVLSTDSGLLGIYLTIYDILVDDDEDIRNQGASIVSWILSDPTLDTDTGEMQNLSLMPLTAKSRLLSFVKSGYVDSVVLCVEAVQRLTGTPPFIYRSGNGNSLDETTNLQLPPVGSLLQEVGQEDTTLFIEEKQNLFKDDVDNAEQWASVLRSLSSRAIPLTVASQVETWVLHGLLVLVDTASNERDGPLGWTSKPAVFTLGMRVILGAQVVLHWAGNGVIISKYDTLRNLLEKLIEVGGATAVHISWLCRIQETLGKSH